MNKNIRLAPATRDIPPRQVKVSEFSPVRRSYQARTVNESAWHPATTRVAVSFEGETLGKFVKRLERAGWLCE